MIKPFRVSTIKSSSEHALYKKQSNAQIRQIRLYRMDPLPDSERHSDNRLYMGTSHLLLFHTLILPQWRKSLNNSVHDIRQFKKALSDCFDRGGIIAERATAFYAAYDTETLAVKLAAKAESQTLSALLGDKILICTGDGFKWVTRDDLQNGQEQPAQHPRLKCPFMLSGRFRRETDPAFRHSRAGPCSGLY